MTNHLEIVFRREAEDELRDAAWWYEERSLGTGSRFMSAVDQVIDSICRTPSLYPRMHGDVRRALVKGFPYGIFYQMEGEVIVVLGVYHAKRDPKKLRKRR